MEASLFWYSISLSSSALLLFYLSIVLLSFDRIVYIIHRQYRRIIAGDLN